MARLRGVAMLATALCVLVTRAATNEGLRHVLLVHPESIYLPAVAAFDKSFCEYLSTHSPVPVSYRTEHICPDSPLAMEMMRAMQSLLRDRYAHKAPDLVVATLPEALDCLYDNGKPLFPDAPILMAGRLVQNLGQTPTNVFPLPLNITLTPTLELALRLHPDTRRIIAVYGSSTLDRRVMETALREWDGLPGRIPVERLTGLSVRKLESRLAALPPGCVVVYGSIVQDVTGMQFVPHDVLRRLHARCSAPIYSFYDAYLGSGVVGGFAYNFDEVGSQTAQVALKLLAGDKPGEAIGRANLLRGRTLLDWRELRRWGIPERRLPPGAIVLNRPETVWYVHRVEILQVVSVFVLMVWLIALMVRNRLRLRRSERDLLLSRSELRRLADRLLQNDEEEHSRIARELHDDFSQRIAALSMDIGKVQRDLQPPSDSGSAALTTIRAGLSRLASDLHGLSRRLHPAVIDDLGLVQALRGECVEIERQTGVAVSFYPDHVPEKIPPAIALCLYRVAQESLRNASKHARAHEIRVFLTAGDKRIELIVEDDGVGFDSRKPQPCPGIGLTGMGERVRMADGELSVVSHPGEGTTVRARLPFNEEDRDEASTAAGG